MQTLSISTRKTRKFIKPSKPVQMVCITPFSLGVSARVTGKQSKANALARVFGVIVSFIKG